MFNKPNEPQSTSAGASQPARDPVKAPGMPSIISADLKVVGDLQCNGDIQVEGKVEGDIKSKTVTVGEGAQVSGSIHADTVRVSGSVQGEIEANEVTLAKSAKVSGDVVHETLSIEAGAHLEGNCRRLQPTKSTAGEPKSEPKVSELKPAAREGGGSSAGEGVVKPASS